jgi:diketogulonate reductase-like aldo/keto reductase
MAIEHKSLGKHGVLVSNIALGTMNFGWHTSQEESFKIIDRALELGINFFDTADVYGLGRRAGRHRGDPGTVRPLAKNHEMCLSLYASLNICPIFARRC